MDTGSSRFTPWTPRQEAWLIPLLLLAVLAPRTAAGSKVEVFDEVWTLTAEHFFDPDLRGVDWQKARARWRPAAAGATSTEDFAAAVNGLLGELHTSHSRLLTRDEPAYYELLDIFSTGPLEAAIRILFPDGEVAYVGIGVYTRTIAGRHHISGVLGGSPAEAAGLRVGDAILSVDGEPFQPIRSFAGKAGESVSLRLQTGPEDEAVVEKIVTPARLQPRAAFLEALRDSATIHEVDGTKVAYLRIWSWAGRHYQDELVALLGAPPLVDADALVLDLRGGWGGAAPEYLGIFDRRIPVLEQIDREGTRHAWSVRWRRPAVLLVDGDTRSGKEVIAWAFQRAGIGPIVGERTAGAVTGGRPFLLSDGSLLYLAVTDIRVDGLRLEGVGVEPDVSVPFELPWAAGRDPQLQRALEVAAKRVRNR